MRIALTVALSLIIQLGALSTSKAQISPSSWIGRPPNQIIGGKSLFEATNFSNDVVSQLVGQKVSWGKVGRTSASTVTGPIYLVKYCSGPCRHTNDFGVLIIYDDLGEFRLIGYRSNAGIGEVCNINWGEWRCITGLEAYPDINKMSDSRVALIGIDAFESGLPGHEEPTSGCRGGTIDDPASPGGYHNC